MRLKKISLRGITRFTGRDPVSIDLDSLSAPIVAVVGENGAGKSTLLEAIPAANYKTMPSRPGSLYEYASGRDAFIEAAYDDNGHDLRVRLLIDAEARKTEGYVFEDGVSLTSGRASEFEALIEQRFGSESLFLASAFSAQTKNGSFLLKKKADRKALFIELLGLASLEVLCQSARDQKTRTDQALALSRSRLESAESEIRELATLETQLTESEETVRSQSEIVNRAREAEAAAAEQLSIAKSAYEQIKPLELQLASASRELESTRESLRQVEAMPASLNKKAAELRRLILARNVEALEPKARQRYQATCVTLDSRETALEKQLLDIPSDPSPFRAELATIGQERQSIRKRQAEVSRFIEANQKASNECRLAIGRLELATQNREQEIARLRRQTGLLSQVPCTITDEWFRTKTRKDIEAIQANLASTCPLLGDARTAQEQLVAIEASNCEAEQKAVDQANADLEQVLLSRPVAEHFEARLSALSDRETEIRTLIGKIDNAAHVREQLANLATERGAAVETLESEVAAAREAVSAARAELTQIDDQLQRDLEAAQASIMNARAQADKAQSKYKEAVDQLESARANLKDLASVASEAKRAAEERNKAEAALRRAEIELAGLRTRVEALREKAIRIQSLRQASADIEMELGDWSLLESSLGKNGVQALEIDAGGPEVARLTNELLEACYGPRFSISFETLREKVSARGEYSEAFDVRVYDNGRERAVEALSGGERVIVSEAISLAIAIFNARKNSVRWRTLFRDETCGALDPDNAQAYVLMLRRALALGGFDNIIFIAHQEEVWRSADAQIYVRDGKVSLSQAA